MSGINKAIAVFTFKSRETILNEGGSSSWKLDRVNARECEYAVCTRNRETYNAEGPEKHRTAFLIGRIVDVVTSATEENRWLLKFSEFAELSLPDIWVKGGRNPVRYTTLEDLGIKLDELDFKPMSEWVPTIVPNPIRGGPSASMTISNSVRGSVVPTTEDSSVKLSIAKAKEDLSASLGIPIDAIEITIKS